MKSPEEIKKKAEELALNKYTKTEYNASKERLAYYKAIIDTYTDRANEETERFNFRNLRDKYFSECVENSKVCFAPHDLFEWFKGNINLLEDVESMIQQAEQQMENEDGWISIEDRLPEDNQKALITNNDTIVIAEYLQKEFYVFEIQDTLAIEEITHWMPLPNPPKLK